LNFSLCQVDSILFVIIFGSNSEIAKMSMLFLKCGIVKINLVFKVESQFSSLSLNILDIFFLFLFLIYYEKWRKKGKESGYKNNNMTQLFFLLKSLFLQRDPSIIISDIVIPLYTNRFFFETEMSPARYYFSSVY
jgi:hypothetical protein